MAGEVRESVLKAVAKALQKKREAGAVADLKGYLFAAFHHRFNRFLKPNSAEMMRLNWCPAVREALVSGLRSGPSLHRLPVIGSLGVARLVSTPSRVSLGLVADSCLRNSLKDHRSAVWRPVDVPFAAKVGALSRHLRSLSEVAREPENV